MLVACIYSRPSWLTARQITHSEWSSSDAFSASAGSNVRADKSGHAAFKRLPFNYCALSLQPFETPVCTAEGMVFDHENIIRWLMKHDTNPVTGKPLKQSDLIKLNFSKNESNEWIDPVTYKVLTDNTHIVAIRHSDSANVFAADTVERLNIKPKMWRDLISDEEFKRSDIITLQDPQNLESRNLTEFKYLKDGEDAGVPKEEASINTAVMGNAADLKILKAKEAVAKARAERASGAVQKVDKTASKPATSVAKAAPTPYNAKHHTTGKAAASFTSTGMAVHTSAAPALMTDEEFLLRRKRVKISGFALIRTTVGEITLELLPEHAPKAVYNFVKLAQKGYYSGVVIHRNIKNFMMQTGDPTGTGRGGASTWGKNFEDELEGPNRHDARGVVSMANKGKDTNSSQFFITYRKVPHLDRKHTIFGRVADGMDVLQAIEDTPTDDKDRPVDEVKMLEVKILVDPFEEFLKKQHESEEVEKAREERRREGKAEDENTTWTGKRIRADGTLEDTGGGVGKYLKLAAQTESNTINDDEPVKKKAKKGGGFGNFDGW
jgi:peptidyl-prolyl cis-trans isomerase-like 2